MPRWRCDLDLRHVGADVFGSVTPHALARQVLSRRAGWRDKANVMGPCQPVLPHPPFFPLFLPTAPPPERPLPASPPLPSKSGVLEGVKWGGIVPLSPLKVFP